MRSRSHSDWTVASATTTIIWDIETGPAPEDELLAMLPEFVPPPHPGEFDPASVRVGNLKDAAKIAAKIDEARTAHESAVRSYGTTVLAAKESHFADFKRSAALSPLTGRVLAIGALHADGVPELIFGTESELIAQFWARFAANDESLAGWNIHGFDLPFLIRRSWKLGIEIPSGVRDRTDRYWDARWIDLMVRFAAGQRNGFVKLDEAARFLGVGAKTGNGGEFAALWETDRAAALAYLRNDLELTMGVARRMGVC